jgi:hypothetical protein
MTVPVAGTHIAAILFTNAGILIDLENVRNTVFEAHVYPHIRIQPEHPVTFESGLGDNSLFCVR